MQFDRYRWQDHLQDHYRSGVDLALAGLFAIGLGTGAILQAEGNSGLAPAHDHLTGQVALSRTLPSCDA